MSIITNLFSSLLLAFWVVAAAVLAVQNVTGVSLRFLGGQTIQIPVGVLLALCVALGVVAGAIVSFVWRISNSLSGKKETT
jgi:uncharacterized integral membrane protein